MHSEPSNIRDSYSRDFARRKFLSVRTASQTPIRDNEWAIPGYLVKGELTILAGPKGTGKSTIYCALAAAVSCGSGYKLWPGALNQEPGGVLIMSAEDSWATTIIPRLIAAGADPTRIVHIDGIDDATSKSTRYAFDAVDTERLINSAGTMGNASLIVIDPWSLIINGDAKNGIKVQRKMEEMKALAVRMNIAILMIAHVSKNSKGRDPVARVSGTAAITDVPRCIFITAKIEEASNKDESTHVFVKAASNLGETNGGLSYSIKGEEVIHNGANAHTSKIVWHSVLHGAPETLLSEAEQTSRNHKLSVPERAAIFLREFLGHGPRSVPEINEAATKAGFSAIALQRAKKLLTITSEKQRNAGSDSPFIWTLHDPDIADKSGVDASSEIL